MMEVTTLVPVVVGVLICSIVLVVGGVLAATFIVRQQNQKNPPRDLDDGE